MTAEQQADSSGRAQRAWLPYLGLWLLPLGFLTLFYFYPLANILAASFGRSQAGALAPFQEIFSSPYLLKVIWFTFWQALLSTLLTLLIGLPGAYLLARFDFPGKSLLKALTSIPFILPTLVVAAAFNALLGPQGWLNAGLMTAFNLAGPPIQLTNTLGAILLAHVFYNTTIVLRMVGDFWSHIDPRLAQAAEVLGATPGQALRRVTLPLLAPTIAAAALLIFIFDFTSFGVILILGGPRYATIEVEIYNQTIGFFNLPLAAALAVIQLACTLALTILYSRQSERLSRPLSLRPQSYTMRKLHTCHERLFAAVMVTILLVLMIAPLAALAIRSVTPVGSIARVPPGQPADSTGGGTQDGGSRSNFTLAYYRELGANRRQSIFYVPPTTAIAISLAYAAMTVLISLFLGLPAAWALAHSQSSWLSRTMDPVIMLPLGTSAVTLGLGFIMALSRPPIDLRASPWLVPLAHTLVAFPFVVRSMAPALRSIRPRLRHAAAVLGASPGDVARRIDLPMAGRALLVAAAFAFTISLGEFGATALLARPEYPTVPVVIYRLLSQPGAMNYGQALALSTILMVVAGLGMLLIERVRFAEVGEF